MTQNVFSCRMIFFLLGFYVGNWTIRIPDIKAQVNTSYTGMGLNFMAFAAGAGANLEKASGSDGKVGFE